MAQCSMHKARAKRLIESKACEDCQALAIDNARPSKAGIIVVLVINALFFGSLLLIAALLSH